MFYLFFFLPLIYFSTQISNYCIHLWNMRFWVNLVLFSRNICSLCILVVAHPVLKTLNIILTCISYHISFATVQPWDLSREGYCDFTVLYIKLYIKQEQYSVRGTQFSVCWWRKQAEMWPREAVPLVWMKPVCCTIRVVGLWSMSPSGNGREGESGLKNDAVPSQAWSPPHEWMNNEQPPLCAVRMHFARVPRDDDNASAGSDVQRWGERCWSLCWKVCGARTDVGPRSGNGADVSIYARLDARAFAWPWTQHLWIQGLKQSSRTPSEREKSSLCFCFLLKQNTPPEIRPLCLTPVAVAWKSSYNIKGRGQRALPSLP